MKYIPVILTILLFLTSCSQFTENNSANKDTFAVKYTAEHSSSGGTRYLDIIYNVVKGNITSCEGTYITDMTDGKQTEACNITKLKTNSYNVPLNLITEYPNKTMDFENLGSSKYFWEIIS